MAFTSQRLFLESPKKAEIDEKNAVASCFSVEI
jgi:hypothetical protein